MLSDDNFHRPVLKYNCGSELLTTCMFWFHNINYHYIQLWQDWLIHGNSYSAGRVHLSRRRLIWHWCFVHDSYTKGEIQQWGGVHKGKGSKVMRVQESKKHLLRYGEAIDLSSNDY